MMKYTDGKIEIDLFDLLENLIKTQKKDLVESLACDCDVIKFVTQQIIDGCTDSGFFGSSCCTVPATPIYGLDWARREVAKASSEVAKKEIEKLEEQLGKANKRYYDLLNEKECQKAY